MISPTAAPGKKRHAEDRTRRFVMSLPVIRLFALLAFVMVLLVSFPLTSHAAPTLIVQDTVVQGQQVEARIENAPQKAQVRWTWDRGRLRLLESGDSAARFEAILDGKGWIEARIGNWRQKVTVVITREGTVKPPPPTGETAKDPKLESSRLLLEQFRSGSDQRNAVFPEHGQRRPVRQGPRRVQGPRDRAGAAAAYPGRWLSRDRGHSYEPGLWAREYRPLRARISCMPGSRASTRHGRMP